MKELAVIQDSFRDDTAVILTTYEDLQKAAKVLESNGRDLMSVINESTLRRFFPHRTIPHQVWISDDKLQHTPKPELVTCESVKLFIENEAFDLPTKNDVLDFDATKHLGIYAERLSNPVIFSTFVTSEMEGLPATIEVRQHQGYRILNFLNVRLVSMYREMLQTTNNNISIGGITGEILSSNNDNLLKVFSIQCTVPDNDNDFKNRIVTHLNNIFDLKIDSVPQNREVYIITELKHECRVPTERIADYQIGHERSLNEFVDALNFSVVWSPGQSLFINESEYQGRLPTGAIEIFQNDIEELQRFLAPYGLTVQRQNRKIKTYVICKNNQTTTT